MQLVAKFVAHLGEAVRRHAAGDVQLARPVAVQLGHLLRQHVVPHGINRRRRVVPVQLVAHQGNDGARLPRFQHIGAIRDQAARAPERVAVLFDRRRVHRECRRMRQQAQEEGDRLFEADHQRLRVDRLNAELRRALLARDDGARIDDAPQHLCVERCGRRVGQAAHAVHEVICGHGVAVRPTRGLAQFERVGQPVVRNGPRFGDARDQLTTRRVAEQALADVAQDVPGLDAARLVGIQRLRVRPQAAV